MLLAIYFAYTPVISALIAHALRNAIDSRLHAELKYDSLTYIFPYHLRMTRVQVNTDATLGDEQLFTVDQLDIRLAHIPIPRRPVVIKSLELKSPALHFIRKETGIVGAKGLRKTDEERRQRPPEHRISDMLELRKFAITDGQVIYEDRTVNSAEPLVFRGIGVDLGVAQQSRSAYSFELHSAEPPVANIDAAGTMDVDTVVLDLSKLIIATQIQRDGGESSVPPKMQRLVNQFAIAGELSVNANGHVEFRDPARSHLSANIKIANARASLMHNKILLDQLDASFHTESHDGQMQTRLRQLVARSGSARMTVDKAVISADRAGWKLADVAGQIDSLTLSESSHPILGMTLMGGTIPFTADGSGEIGTGVRPRFSLAGHPRGVTLLLPGFTTPAEHIAGEIRIGPERLELWNVSGELLSGQVTGSGAVELSKPAKYDAQMEVRDLDVARLTAMPLMHGKAREMTGTGYLSAHFSGETSHDGTSWLDHLSATGEAQVSQGRFWQGKTLGAIAEGVGLSRESVTTGDAATVFSIADRVINFRSGALNTSVLGLQVHGSLSFQGDADLNVIAAPLGDWRKQIEGTKIPLLSDVAGQLAGAVQKLVNSTSKYLYAFEVKGKLPDPQIRAVPAPVLTSAAANVFGKMLQEVKSADLLKSIKE